MKINVTELLKRLGNKDTLEFSEKLNFPEDNIFLEEPVRAEIKLINTGKSILLTGKITTAVSLTCGRCLKEYTEPLEVELEEKYSQKVKQSKSGNKKNEYELGEEDFIFPIEDEQSIDLTEAIRQNIIISIPIKSICSEECKNVEKEEEKKKKKEIDPRLSKLKEAL